MDSVRRLVGQVEGLVGEAQRGIARNTDAPRVAVLGVVAGEGPVRPGAVARRLDMAPSSVTRHVQALEDAGQLSVRPDPDDARTCLLELTPAGRAELDELAQVGAQTFAAVVEDWPDDDLEALARLIGRLRRDWAEREETARRRPAPDRTPRWRRPTRTETPDDRDRDA
jgi:DNA-binding MarR family transcriptional regulator